MANTLEQLFTEHREKYQKQREDAQAKLEEAEAELRALDAYENAKKAKPTKPSRTNGETKPRKPRGTGKRGAILKLVEQYPDGVTAGELKEHLGIKGDKVGEQSLSNALAALRKGGRLTLTDGKYASPAPE